MNPRRPGAFGPWGRRSPAGTGMFVVHVLLVGCDGVVRMYLTEVLDDAGVNVTAMPDAEGALRLADAIPAPTVLVSDVGLGRGMDGVALAAEARRRWPAVGVVLMSGTPGNRARCCLCASDRFLLKPFGGDALLEVIGELTGGGRRGATAGNI